MSAMAEDSSTAPIPVLQPARHQVAGHGFNAGPLGPSVDGLGRFYKPLQDDVRGDREIDFYEKLQSDEGVPPWIRSFFPKYFGKILITAPSSSKAVRHGIMEDVTHGYRHPSIIDLKIGSRTWYPEATQHSITKNKVKDKQTTSAALGFRVSGMQVYESSRSESFKADRIWARNLNVDEVLIALKRYVSSNPRDGRSPDTVFADTVYGGPDGVIAQLKVLEEWFTKQDYYHFASSSVLVLYEGGDLSDGADSNGKPYDPESSRFVTVKLIDFAHTIPGKSSLDENFLGGLRSLISILSQITQSHTSS